MDKGTKFDIALTRTEALFLLKPGGDGASICDKNNVEIMCKEYGNDDDWVGVGTDDYETILEDDVTYKTFEIWLSNVQGEAKIRQLIESLNIPEEKLLTIAVLCTGTNEVDIITTRMVNDDDMIETFLSCHCQYDLDNINWMAGNEIKVSYLTEKSFGADCTSVTGEVSDVSTLSSEKPFKPKVGDKVWLFNRDRRDKNSDRYGEVIRKARKYLYVKTGLHSEERFDIETLEHDNGECSPCYDLFSSQEECDYHQKAIQSRCEISNNLYRLLTDDEACVLYGRLLQRKDTME